MGLSNIAVAQREKEDEALRYFLVFSLIGSLALHIAVLILGSFWLRKPELAEKPIKVIVVDAPSPQAAKPKQKTQLQGGTIARGTGSGSQGGRTRGTSSVASSQATMSTAIAQLSRPVIAKKPSQPTETAAIKKPVATKPPKPVATPKPVPPLPPPKPIATPKPPPIPLTASSPNRFQIRASERTRQPTPVSTPSQRPIATPKPTSNSQSPQPVVPSPPDNAGRETDHKNVAAGLRNQERSGSGSGSGTRDSRLATGTGTGLGNVGTGSGTGTGNESNALGSGPSGSGRIACRRCPDPSYPRRAQREGWEGTVKVVFDADREGNVSNVRLASSSGYDLLDQAAIKTVKNWQLASSETEQRGILQSFTFARLGSDTERLARERRQGQER